MMKKLAVDTREGYEVTVDLGTDLQKYAMNFLKIFNNVKSNQAELIRVTNDYHNRVSVTCEAGSVDATKEFLSMFGEVVNVEKVLLVSLEDDVDYDFDKYDDLVIVPFMN